VVLPCSAWALSSLVVEFPELRIPRHESRDSSLAAEELGVEGEGAAVRPLLSDERSASPAARQAL